MILSHDLWIVTTYRYITVLVEMTKFEGTHHGKKIAAQMLDVSIRVKDVRSFAVRQMVSIIDQGLPLLDGKGWERK